MIEFSRRKLRKSIYLDNCLPNSCFSDSVCKLINRTARCVQCRWHSHDTDSQCRLRSFSFGEDGGYIVLPLQITRLEWKLQFRFAKFLLLNYEFTSSIFLFQPVIMLRNHKSVLQKYYNKKIDSIFQSSYCNI